VISRSILSCSRPTKRGRYRYPFIGSVKACFRNVTLTSRGCGAWGRLRIREGWQSSNVQKQKLWILWRLARFWWWLINIPGLLHIGVSGVGGQMGRKETGLVRWKCNDTWSNLLFTMWRGQSGQMSWRIFFWSSEYVHMSKVSDKRETSFGVEEETSCLQSSREKVMQCTQFASQQKRGYTNMEKSTSSGRQTNRIFVRFLRVVSFKTDDSLEVCWKEKYGKVHLTTEHLQWYVCYFSGVSSARFR